MINYGAIKESSTGVATNIELESVKNVPAQPGDFEVKKRDHMDFENSKLSPPNNTSLLTMKEIDLTNQGSATKTLGTRQDSRDLE